MANGSPFRPVLDLMAQVLGIEGVSLGDTLRVINGTRIIKEKRLFS